MMRRLYLLIGAAFVIVAVALSYTYLSSQTHPSQTVYVDTTNSGCRAHLNQFNCTLTLSSRQGAISASQVSSVTVNDTVASTSVKTGANGTLAVEADITITTIRGGLNDVNNIPPSSSGTVVVYLKDGTTVSVTLPGEYVE